MRLLIPSILGILAIVANGSGPSAGLTSFAAPDRVKQAESRSGSLRLHQIAQIDCPSRAWLVAWSPDGRRLIYETGDYHDDYHYTDNETLHEWPSGRSVKLPDYVGTKTARWSPDGTKVLFRGGGVYSGGGPAVILRIRDLTFRKLTIPAYSAWWRGSNVEVIGPDWFRPDEESDREAIYLAGRKVARLPPSFRTEAMDESGRMLMTKYPSKRYPYGMRPYFGLHWWDDRARKLRLWRTVKGAFVEYTAQDTVEWNHHLDMAVVTVTSDTGASMCALVIVGRHAAWWPRARDWAGPWPLSFPQWIGDRALVALRYFSEDDKRVYERRTVELIDPVKRTRRQLLSMYHAWDAASYPESALATPLIEACSATPDGSKLAYLIRAGKRSQIKIVRLNAIRAENRR